MEISFFKRINTKIIALVLGLLAVTTFVTDRLYFYSAQQLLVAGEINALEDEARLLLSPMRYSVNEMQSDIRKANAELLLRANLQRQAPPNWDTVAQFYLQLISSKPLYSALSFVDTGGQERIKLERSGSNVLRLGDTALHNIAQEAYFAEGLKQAPSAIYFSPIQLKKNNQRIARPAQFVLHGVTPRYRNDGSLAGVVILTLDVSQLIEGMRENISSRRQLYVTNTYGEYIAHPQRDSWMGEKAQAFTIQQEFPETAQVINGAERTVLAETVGDRILSYQTLPFDPLNPRRLIGVGLSADKAVLLQDVHALQQKNLLFIIGVLIAATGVAAIFGGMISRPVVKISNLAQAFPKRGDTSQLPVARQDEIGMLARSLLRLVDQVEAQEWLREGQLKISESARGGLSLKDTAYNVLKTICRYLQVPLGALYRVAENGDYELLAGYAIKGQAKASPHIAAGDSMFAIALEEGLVLIDNHLPDNYFRIHSGLGDIQPNHRIIAPILIERKRVAVLELASLRPITKEDQLLLERIIESIGLVIKACASRDELEQSLEETKQQQEELKSSNEELVKQSAELELQQSQLEEQASELEVQNNQLAEQKNEIAAQALNIENQLDELKKVSGYKSDFLANMSHELRTPLNSLLILAKAFQENSEGNLTEEQVQEATIIYNGGVELLNLINDVLDFSKIEAGKINIVKGQVQIATVVQKLIRQYTPLLKDKSVVLKSHIAADVPQQFSTDAQRLEQVLVNLLSNAIKFTTRGHISIEVHLEPSDNIRFSVIDTGIGIDAEKHSEIFEAFKQEDGSIERKYGGTGLGLSISRQLTELLGGRITLVSEKDKGSTFSVVLPLHSEAEASSSEPTSNLSQDALVASIGHNLPKLGSEQYEDKRELLIVEDDTKFANVLKKLAQKKGFTALIANTGKDALLIVQAHKPRAVILDLMLPDMDGMRVLQYLKNDIKTRHIPVHVVSAKEEHSRYTYNSGAAGFLTKPLRKEDADSLFASVANMNQEAVKNVLLIEDDTNTQHAIKKLLDNRKINITSVGEGKLGIENLCQQNFDCVILDLQLPDMTGFEWLQQVETLRDTNVPPVVVYTARKLSREETIRLEQYTGSVIIKGAHSPERLLDEVMLFLHSIEASLSKAQHDIISQQHTLNNKLQGRKILLVDDDMRNVFAISKMLKKQGLDVVIADNGQMALEKLDKHNDISLAVMDIMMPVMDGYEAIRAIRKSNRYAELPIIALTARTMPDERENCLLAGANDYLAKPVDIDVLLTLMRVLLFLNHEKSA